MSIERTTVYADPTLVTDPVGEAAKLAPMRADAESDAARARSPTRAPPSIPRRFAYLAHTVDDDVAAARCTRSKLPGHRLRARVGAELSRPGRSRARSSAACDADGTGLDGIEPSTTRCSRARPATLVVEQDPLGPRHSRTPQQTQVDAQRGTDVVLTLDEDLQWQAEYSLLDQVKATERQGRHGRRRRRDERRRRSRWRRSHGATRDRVRRRSPAPASSNAPLTDLFEPGSTNKLITLSWALEHGHVAPDTMFTVPYSITVDPHVKPYTDAEPHTATTDGIEHWTTADILRESSNVGTIKIAQTDEEPGARRRRCARSGSARRPTIDWPVPAGRVC